MALALVIAIGCTAPASRPPPSPPPSIDVPFEVLGNAIYVSARVNGRGPFLVALDTGSCCAVFASELIGELGMHPEGRARAARPGRRAVAGHRRSLTMPELAVNLGGKILRRFTVTIDYPDHTVTLEPNARFADPFPLDASGLVIEARGDDFRTFVVAPVPAGSPAAEADVQPGDTLVAIAGKPAPSYVLWQVMDVLKAAGQRVPLTLTRGGRMITCALA